MGDLRSGKVGNILGWGAFGFVAVAVFLISQSLGLFGIQFLGG